MADNTWPAFAGPWMFPLRSEDAATRSQVLYPSLVASLWKTLSSSIQVGATGSVCHLGSALSVTRAECVWRAGLGKGSAKCPSVSVHSFSWPHYMSIAFVRVSGGDRCPSCRKGNLVTPRVFPSHRRCLLCCLAAFSLPLSAPPSPLIPSLVCLLPFP